MPSAIFVTRLLACLQDKSIGSRNERHAVKPPHAKQTPTRLHHFMERKRGAGGRIGCSASQITEA
ncbi:hypothetical protein EYF80_052756 [Liparis tanakae]|uniref:Uncharacterized protein n=1 Tax=Liparis tanakae TaxID=230148 RepID=A0A4Z2F756_9TELE|nr:hypothetical protein EYF80_052756 [Liparis tanakae]